MTIHTDDGDYDTAFGTFPYGLMIPYKRDRIFGNLDLTVGFQIQFYEATITAADETLKATAGSLGFFFGLAF